MHLVVLRITPAGKQTSEENIQRWVEDQFAGAVYGDVVVDTEYTEMVNEIENKSRHR